MPEELYRTASPSFAMGQLARAAEQSDRARQWRDVLAGMADGTLTIGSRTPVADTPPWVTLEVAHGGFTTGRFLAEADDAESLNLRCLTDEGQAELLEALRHGRYRVDVPEEAALAVAVVLLDRGFTERALDLLDELRPWMNRLRLVPTLAERPRPSGSAVRLRTVGEVSAALREITVPAQIAAMRRTLGVWDPLYDRLITLWCRTVEGDLPRLEDGAVVGGWPCRVWPADWTRERDRWLADVETAGTPSGRHGHPKSNFARLHKALLTGDNLTARDVGWIRRALANTLTRHGAPGSPRREEIRAAQTAVVAMPTFASHATELATRLDRYPAGGGLPSVEPVADGIPPHLVAKAERALEAPVDELVHRGVITSGEVLAMVLPQLTSRLAAAGFDDPVLAGLYEQTYTAFRRRRSLLLLNLESQVRFEELPWVAALDPLREPRATTAAYQTLRETTLLALTAFPQDLLPNPLITELEALAKQAGVKLPFVQEVAADIFMGTFTPKWRDAARLASAALADTVYARYYDLPPVSYWDTPPTRTRWGRKVAPDFDELCEARAAEAGAGRSVVGGYVARNGTILEQSQILTTHNLATLVFGLDLAEPVRAYAPELVTRTFDWVLRRLSLRAEPWAARAHLRTAAYAWRQAIFLLGFCAEAEQVSQVERLLAAADSRFRPAIEVLARAVAGERITEGRFLGWSVGPSPWLPSE